MKAAIALTACIAAPALACTPRIEGGKSLESVRYFLSYRTDPARVQVGKPFAVDLVVCPKDAASTIAELRVDAHMPAHRHGMNYKASVKLQPESGHYRAEGLMFHMPGRWEFLFDVRDAAGIERLRQAADIK